MAKWNKFIQTYFGCQWPGWIVVALWTIAAITLTYYTIRDIQQLQDDFYSNNTATQMEVIKNGSIPDPEMFACLPYYSGAIENMAAWLNRVVTGRQNESSFRNCTYCQAMNSNSWDIWRGIKDLKQFQGLDGSSSDMSYHLEVPICTNIRQKLFQNNTGEPNFDVLLLKNGNSFNWNQPIIDCLFRFFVQIAAQDFGNFGYTNLAYNAHDIKEIGDIGSLDKEVVDKMMQLLLKSISIFQNQAISNKVITEAPFLLLPYKICSQLLPNMDSEIVGYQVDYQSDPLWNDLGHANFAVYTDYLTPKSFMDPLEAIFFLYIPNLMQSAPSTSSISIDTESVIVEARSNRLQKCSNEQNRARCLARRQYNDTMDLCGCIPFSFTYYLRTNDTHLPYCNSSHYESCSELLHDNTKRHMDYCSDKCEQIFYRLKVTKPEIMPKIDENAYFFLRIEYKRPRNPFLKFTITEKTTDEQYTSQLGGIVNLYLGFSGFTACAIVIILVDLFKRWFNIAKNSRTESPENSLFSKLRLYWATRILWNARSNENQQLSDLKLAIENLQGVNEDLNTRMERLQGVNSDIRLSNEKQQELIKDLKLDNEKQQERIEKQQELIEKLQENVARIDQHLNKRRPEGIHAREDVKTTRV